MRPRCYDDYLSFTSFFIQERDDHVFEIERGGARANKTIFRREAIGTDYDCLSRVLRTEEGKCFVHGDVYVMREIDFY